MSATVRVSAPAVGLPAAESLTRTPGRRALVRTLNVLLVLSIIPWQSNSIFTGGIDPIVVGKALVAMVALAGAAGIAYTSHLRSPVGLGPAFLVVLVLLVSALGALVERDPLPTLVLAIRMMLVLATLLLLLRATSWESGIADLLMAMGVIALVAAATGVPGMLAEGRLGGGIPELHPNGLAGLAGTPFVGLAAVVLHQGLRLWSAIAGTVLFGIVLATGSRTALLAVLVALVVAVLVNGIRDRKLVYLLLVSLPVLYVLATFTDVLTDLATRAGETDTTSTLESRFDAWNVVLGWSWTSWAKWIGIGLAVKQVDVDMKWRDYQVLDSSWVSILAQGGLIGAVLVALLVTWCLIGAVTSRRRRWLVLPLLALVVLRSATESGLFDSAEPFVVLMLVAAALTRRSAHADSDRMSMSSGRAGYCPPTGAEPSRRARAAERGVRRS